MIKYTFQSRECSQRSKHSNCSDSCQVGDVWCYCNVPAKKSLKKRLLWNNLDQVQGSTITRIRRPKMDPKNSLLSRILDVGWSEWSLIIDSDPDYRIGTHLYKFAAFGAQWNRILTNASYKSLGFLNWISFVMNLKLYTFATKSKYRRNLISSVNGYFHWPELVKIPTRRLYLTVRLLVGEVQKPRPSNRSR